MKKKNHLWKTVAKDPLFRRALETDESAFLEGFNSVPAELDGPNLVAAHNISSLKPDANPAYIHGRVLGAILAFKNYQVRQVTGE